MHLVPIDHPAAFLASADREAPPSDGALAPPDLDLPQPETLDLDPWMLGPMIGRSPAMQHLFARMRCTAPHFRLATVEGEPGTGKLITAQTLSRIGPAAAGPFVPCTAAEFLQDPPALWKDTRAGLLYLARVDELSPEQQRLLRDFLERAAHERIRTHGVSSPLQPASLQPGPLQIVAGSSQPLRRLAAAGSFRSDLAGHLTAIRFALPPLRERREDLPLLAGLFLRQWSQRHRKPLRGFAPGTLARLAAHPWPGNVRELESAIAAAALDCPGQWIRPLDLPRLQWPAPAPASAAETFPDDPSLDRAILRHVVRVLAQASGNKVRAARMLGISRSTLYRLLESGPSLPLHP